MSEGRHYNAIWLMIGVLLAVYGILIVGAGLYNLAYPSQREVVLSHLRPELWWGGFMIVVGILFCHSFLRKRK